MDTWVPFIVCKLIHSSHHLRFFATTLFEYYLIYGNSNKKKSLKFAAMCNNISITRTHQNQDIFCL